MTREEFLAELDRRCRALRRERETATHPTTSLTYREVQSAQVNALADLVYDILVQALQVDDIAFHFPERP